MDIAILLTLLLFAAFSLYFITLVFLSFANKVLKAQAPGNKYVQYCLQKKESLFGSPVL